MNPDAPYCEDIRMSRIFALRIVQVGQAGYAQFGESRE